MLIKISHLAEVPSARVFSPPENIRKTQKFPDVFFCAWKGLFFCLLNKNHSYIVIFRGTIL